MNFYAYEPDKNGNEPMGTEGRVLFELKTTRGAIRRAFRRFSGRPFRLYKYTNFYNDKTFTLIYENK